MKNNQKKTEFEFHEMIHTYWSRNCEQAAQHLDRHDKDIEYLDHLLRNHFDEPIIIGKEIQLRDACDSLVSFYGLMELACLSGFLNSSMPKEFSERGLCHLSNKSFRKFYETNYPQLLPTQFRRRLLKQQNLVERNAKYRDRLFIQFLDISNMLNDDDVDALQTLLDDFVIDGISWIDLRKVIRNPKKFIGAIATNLKDQTFLHKATRGYQSFLVFCCVFHQFLSGLSEQPTLQSAFWHHHSYWFSQLKDKMEPELKRSLASILSLQSELSQDSDKKRKSDAEKDNSNKALESKTKNVAAQEKKTTTAEVHKLLKIVKELMGRRFQSALKIASTS